MQSTKRKGENTMRNLTMEEKMEFAKEMNKFCTENQNFCEDVKQVALLMK